MLVYRSLPTKCTPWFTSIVELFFIISCAPPPIVISGRDFFRGGGYNTPCYGKINQDPQVVVKS
jgi:hypothetical protein